MMTFDASPTTPSRDGPHRAGMVRVRFGQATANRRLTSRG